MSSTTTGINQCIDVPGAETKSRIFSLDVLRGIALFGILFISIWEFGGFTTNDQLLYRTSPHGFNYKLMAAVSALFEGKMRGLLSLVFGTGIILFVQRKEHLSALSSADAHARRMMWLMGFGLINAFILLWPGDLLFQYGVMGLLLFGFTRMKARGFFMAALVCTLIYCGKQYWNYADDKKAYQKYTAVLTIEKKFKVDSTTRAKRDSVDRMDSINKKDILLQNKLADSLAKKTDTLTTKQKDEKGNWEGITKSFKYDSSATAATHTMMRDDWNKVAYMLIPKSQQKESTWLYKIGIWDLGSLMFIGMALLSIGFFSKGFSSSKYFVIALLGILAGLALAWFRIHYNCVRSNDYEKYIQHYPIPYNIFFPIERLLMSIGYAAGILWLVRLDWKVFRWILRGFAAAGQMALTNYILQTIICTFFFYGFGFSYFGKLTQTELYVFVAEMILVQVVFSVFWLRYFTMGPLEWLWKCMIYKKKIAIKKSL